MKSYNIKGTEEEIKELENNTPSKYLKNGMNSYECRH